MKGKNALLRYIGVLTIVMFASITACSYMADMAERTITKRASFSIKATYDHATQTVSLSWDESGGGNFEGYEIYMTESPDDEYSGYRVVAAGYAINGESYFDNSIFLTFESTQSFNYNVYNYISTFGAGRYFFRVGIIAWDEDSDERNAENGYTGNPFTDYKSHTDIDEISGHAMVDLYL